MISTNNNEIMDMIYKSSPKYLVPFLEGFECGKSHAISILKDALLKIESIKAVRSAQEFLDDYNRMNTKK